MFVVDVDHVHLVTIAFVTLDILETTVKDLFVMESTQHKQMFVHLHH